MDKEYYKNVEEIWKDVVGYIGLYMVSDWGRIKRLIRKFNNDQVSAVILLNNKNLSDSEIARQTGVNRVSVRRILKNPQKYLNQETILKPWVCNEYGHLCISLSKNNIEKKCLIHRLVLEAFIGPCAEGMEVRHLDGKPSNNIINNLKYGTSKENSQDMRVHKTFIFGSKNWNAILDDEKILEILKLIEESNLTQNEIAYRYGVSPQTICDIKKNRIWKHVKRPI
jgi:predicted DNA-binding protein (UPF0251 family)